MISITDIIPILENFNYVITKLHFDDVSKPESLNEISVLSQSAVEISHSIIKKFTAENRSAESIEIENSADGFYTYINISDTDSKACRIELLSSFSVYNRLSISDRLITNLISDAVLINSEAFTYKTLSEEGKLLLEYIEYVEFFDQSDLKTIHLQQIFDTFDPKFNYKHFLKRLHAYIKLKPAIPAENLANQDRLQVEIENINANLLVLSTEIKANYAALQQKFSFYEDFRRFILNIWRKPKTMLLNLLRRFR